MTPSQRRYVFIETAISIVINTLISIGFVYLVFGGIARIATAALIPDSVPQSFMIALMSTIVPTLLTRKRLRAGSVAPLDWQIPRLLKALPVRALLIAFVAAAVGLAVHAILLGNIAPNELSFAMTLTFKATFGAILAGIVTAAEFRHALPAGLLDALIAVESAYRPGAVSAAGAAGLAQLMPDTARSLGVVDRFDILASIEGGARYLRAQLDRFDSIALALAAYNAGPGAVRRAGGIPRNGETPDYVSKVLAAWSALAGTPA